MVRKAFLAELLILLALLTQPAVRVTVGSMPCSVLGECPFGSLELAPSDAAWMMSDGSILGGFCLTWLFGTHEIVLPPNYTYANLVHERCHTQQDTYLRNGDFPTTVAPWDNLYLYTPDKVLAEDAANTCAAYRVDPNWLKQTSPERYAWADKYIGGHND